MIQRGRKGEQRATARRPQKSQTNGATKGKTAPKLRIDPTPIVFWAHTLFTGQRLCWPAR
jgi:hypothetical protein